jgi:hypothetical protein
MSAMAIDLAELRALLERTPACLDALLAGLPSSWVHANEGPSTWSAFDVVGHLIHGDETDWIPRARIVLEHGEARAFEPFDRFAQEHDSRGKILPQLLARFAEVRAASLRTLHDLRLTPADLERTGTHPELGRVTLGELLTTWAAHDAAHLAQIARVLAKHLGPGVGPWRDFLPVLER